MVVRSFSVSEEVYRQFAEFCRARGMSKQVQFLMESFIDNEPSAKEAYLKRLEKIRKGKFIRIKGLSSRYG